MTDEDKGVWTKDGWMSAEDHTEEVNRQWAARIHMLAAERKVRMEVFDTFLSLHTPTRWQRFKSWVAGWWK